MQSNLKDIDTPVCPQKFVQQFTKKCESWKDFVVTTKLQETWRINCLALNNAINDEGEVIKYVVSAPTGSAKTQNLITYCTMLPDKITALISTNLTDEADGIVKEINKEAGKQIAYSHHSNIEGVTTSKSLDKAVEFQIVVTTHAFYKDNYVGGDKWEKLGADRDLLVIDEALDTMKEISVKDTEIIRAIAVFTKLSTKRKYKNNPRFTKELQWLQDDFKVLNTSPPNLHKISSDRIWTLSSGSKILSIELTKYTFFAEILGIDVLGEEKSLREIVKYENILTGTDNPSLNKIIKNELTQTINNMNKLRNRQVYITTNGDTKSFNRVEDMIFKKSLVCFDATADVNEVYSLRSEYYNDIHMVKKINKVRDYSSVTMHTVAAKTGKDDINIQVASSTLQSVILGKKTLIITHQDNEAFFLEVAKTHYEDKTIEVAHWGAITGLNDWKDFDTCIVVGLNNKPIRFSQNRVIANVPNEDIAFGEQQAALRKSITDSTTVAEIIQAINRIRIRTVTEKNGSCKSANIYITLPIYKDENFKKLIKDQMPNIKIVDWALKTNITYHGGKGGSDSIVLYLNGKLNYGDRIRVGDVKKALGIKTDNYNYIMGKTPAKKKEFKEKLESFGLELIEVNELGANKRARKTPVKYFSRNHP